MLHKWDNYNAHSMDMVAKYLYQYFDTQTTEKLCLLFNMLESNTNNDNSRSRWEADDRWVVHADDVAEIEWPGEKRQKRKHHAITPSDPSANVLHNNGTPASSSQSTSSSSLVDEDDKRTKAKRWDTFSKFLARIGFLKSSSKKSMAWVCSWNDTSGVFCRSKLVAAAQGQGQGQGQMVPNSSASSTSSSSQSNIPVSPQIPLSPHTPSSVPYTPPPYPQSMHTPRVVPQDYHPYSFNRVPSPQNVLPPLSNHPQHDNNTVTYQQANDSTLPFAYFLQNSSSGTSSASNNTPTVITAEKSPQEQLSRSRTSSSESGHGDSDSFNMFTPLDNSAEKVPPIFPPTTSMQSYLRDISGISSSIGSYFLHSICFSWNISFLHEIVKYFLFVILFLRINSEKKYTIKLMNNT